MKKIFIPSLLLLFSGCKILNQAASYDLKTGFYQTKDINGKKKQVYIMQLDDSLRAYQLKKISGNMVADSIHYTAYTFPPTRATFMPVQYFVQKRTDIDIISIAFKLRPATKPLPPQLNTNFNAAGYFGYRWDKYAIRYNKTPLNKFEKSSHHFAYGFGVFGGIGATAMNEYVTLPPIDHQYEGVVCAKGISGIIGVGHISFGLAVGSDNLFGEHRQQWIYQNKLWTGVTIGLNLN